MRFFRNYIRDELWWHGTVGEWLLSPEKIIWEWILPLYPVLAESGRIARPRDRNPDLSLPRQRCRFKILFQLKHSLHKLSCLHDCKSQSSLPSNAYDIWPPPLFLHGPVTLYTEVWFFFNRHIISIDYEILASIRIYFLFFFDSLRDVHIISTWFLLKRRVI